MESKPDITTQLNNSTVELLDFIRKTAEQTQDFVVEQTPLFIQEYLQYSFLSSQIAAVVTFVIVIILLIIPWVIYKFSKKMAGKCEDCFYYVCPTATAAAVVVIAASVLLSHTYFYTMECIKIKTAPRVYLVDTLLKKVK